jgi:hypothetical protein
MDTMKRIRVVGLIIVIVCAMSAIVAASASALPPPFEFRAETYPVEVLGHNTSIHRFEFGPGVLVLCEGATFNTNENEAPNPTKPQRQLEVHPVYSKCSVSLPGGIGEAVVRTNRCNYVLTAIKPEEKNGPIALHCATRPGIEVALNPISGCVLEIGPQTLTGIEYGNEAGPPKKVKVNAEVDKINYKASSQCGVAGVGGNGSYRGSAVFNGFKPLTTEADGLEVRR